MDNFDFENWPEMRFTSANKRTAAIAYKVFIVVDLFGKR